MGHIKFIIFDLLLFRKKLLMRCKCDLMNMFVDACVSLKGKDILFFSALMIIYTVTIGGAPIGLSI